MDRTQNILLFAAIAAAIAVAIIYLVDFDIRERRRVRERKRQIRLDEILRVRHLARRRASGELRRAAPDCLNSLGLDQEATTEDVVAAYRQIAFKLHPDRGGDPDEFKRLQRNFEQAMAYAEGRVAAKPSKPR